MQIVINIPDEIYKRCRNYSLQCGQAEILEGAVANGTPLPEGFWKHKTQDGGCFWEECSVCHTERAFPTKYCPDCGAYMYANIRTNIPTIIEADKEDN